ncbi:MAG: hypothetical protein Q8M03_16180 [Legionella sp.]|nr:hypothetical protein [Legionella sp.]
MWEIIKRYWQVSIFKETPANTPHSMFLLISALVLYLTMLITQWSIIDIKQKFTFVHSLLAAVCLLASYLIYTALLLKLFKKTGRFLQTMTTLLMTSLIIHVFAFPLLLMSSSSYVAGLQQTALLLFASTYLLVTLMLSLWQLGIIAYIYKLALELNGLSAMLVSFGWLAFNILNVSIWR